MAANEIPLRSDLNEQVLMIPVDKTFYGADIQLETTFFTPKGQGPFPLILINEGKMPGNPIYQDRARYPLIAKEFLKRGYAVALPMQRGFSKSGGSSQYMESCNNIYSSTTKQATDIKSVLQYLSQRPDINPQKIIVAGQSFGGLSTLALANDPPQGVQLLLNFAGGLKNESCRWEDVLTTTSDQLGRQAKVPSLWFYGENDNLFPPELAKKMFTEYSKTNQTAELIVYGKYKDDAHIMFGSKDGFEQIWWPKVEGKLRQLGFPTQVNTANIGTQPEFKATNYAAVDDFEKLAAVANEKCLARYQTLIKETPSPCAFAIADNGTCGFSYGGYDDNAISAINYCQSVAKDSKCKLYLVDDNIVWPNS